QHSWRLRRPRSGAECRDGYHVDSVRTLAGAAGRGNHDEGGRCAVPLDVDLRGEVDEPLGRVVDNAFIAGEFHLECGPGVRSLHDRVDLLSPAHLTPGRDRPTE